LVQAKANYGNSSGNPDLTQYGNGIKFPSQQAPKQTKKDTGAENDAVGVEITGMRSQPMYLSLQTIDNVTAPAHSNKIVDPEKLAMVSESRHPFLLGKLITNLGNGKESRKS
jgi:hypothetical protein